MRTDPRPIATVWMLVTILLVSCRGSPDEHAARMAASSRCEAPGVDVPLRDALCKGGAAEIRAALFRLESTPGEPARDRLLAVLNRLWMSDRSYGTELPWPALESPENRAVFADYLAQGVRNAEIGVPLPDLQRFALELVRGAPQDVDQLEGLRLLGLTDSQDQVPLLRRVALATEGPMLRRRYAIEALGYICAGEAALALRAIGTTHNPQDTALVEAAAQAERTRSRLSASWCRAHDARDALSQQ